MDSLTCSDNIQVAFHFLLFQERQVPPLPMLADDRVWSIDVSTFDTIRRNLTTWKQRRGLISFSAENNKLHGFDGHHSPWFLWSLDVHLWPLEILKLDIALHFISTLYCVVLIGYIHQIWHFRDCSWIILASSYGMDKRAAMHKAGFYGRTT